MDFAQWLTANGYDEAELTETQRKHLQAAWKAETAPAPTPPAPTPAPTPATAPAPASSFDEQMAAIERENQRIEAIQEITSSYAAKVTGNRQKIERIKQLCAAAVADKKCTVDSFRLTMLQEDRSTGLIISVPQSKAPSEDVVEAAICSQYKLPGIEKRFSDQTLQSAHDQFRHGVGLKRLLLMGARARGFRGDDSDAFTLARHAMRSRGDDAYELRADVGPSTGIQVPGILSNVANKFIAPAFHYTEQTWRLIAKIGTVSDFKTKTTYRMTGANTYKKVAPSGEIKHGALSELSYTDQAETYGIMLGVSRNDMINDDLGAFVTMSQEIGRGAGDVLNNIFWAEWLDDSDFFNTDGSKANYDAGAIDSVLSDAGLENADAILGAQTKPDGTPLGVEGAILLVPRSLRNTARKLMTSETMNLATSSAAVTGNTNTWNGAFQVASSVYLSRTSLPDGNGISQTVAGSSTAWYLLADPNNVPAISVVFLFGKEMPTVESEDFEFDRLGIATRAYFDFGCNKHEYRGAVKLKGAA